MAMMSTSTTITTTTISVDRQQVINNQPTEHHLSVDKGLATEGRNVRDEEKQNITEASRQ